MESYREITSKLNNNRVYLINNLDIENGLIDSLIQKRTLTNCMVESIMSKPTRTRKIGELLNILSRRGPETLPSLKEALKKSHQICVHNVLFPEDIVDNESIVFFKLSEAIDNLDNAVENYKRHGEIYLTTTATYNEQSPVSKIGLGMIPYLFAHRAVGYPKSIIVNMEGCCDPDKFDKLLNVYDSEIEEIRRIIENLKDGGLHFNIEIKNEKLKKLFEKRNIKLESDRLNIVFDMIDTDRISRDVLTFYACQIHLMCFGKYSFVIRKSRDTRPNCYLLFQAKLDSPVIKLDDREYIREAISLNEIPKQITFSNVAVDTPW